METTRLTDSNDELDFARQTVLSSQAFDQLFDELDKPMDPNLAAFVAKKSIWDN